MTTVRLEGWSRAPKVGVVLPDRRDPGWIDAAFWCALLEAWGFRAERIGPRDAATGGCTTLIVPAASLDGALQEHLTTLDPATMLLVGSADPIPALAGARRFDETAATLDAHTTERVVDRAHDALFEAAPYGLVGLWRWPDAAEAALVVDGDVDHPTGVDPECARYVAPAIETMRRAGFPAYGIYAAAANVEAEPHSFPGGADYYNHSFSHPYSHWNPRPWESLTDVEMAEEIVRSDETFEDRLGHDDHQMFRLPHFQLDASTRTYAVLDRLGYRADSSIGGTSRSPADSLPSRHWSPGAAAAGRCLRTHPTPILPRATASCRSPSAPTRRTPTSRTDAVPTTPSAKACASGPPILMRTRRSWTRSWTRRSAGRDWRICSSILPTRDTAGWTATPSTTPALWSGGWVEPSRGATNRAS